MDDIKLTIDINPRGAAITDDPTGELRRLFDRLATSVINGNDRGVILDSNGTPIAEWRRL